MLFQLKQRYNEDDLRALDRLQQKQLRLVQAKLLYAQVCAAVTALLLLFATGLIIFQALSSGVRGTVFRDFLIMMVWFIFVPRTAIMLILVALPSKRDKALLNYPERTYTFYEDHFTIEEPDLTLKRLYTGVNKFVETDDRFFIYISSGSAYILRKSRFTAGDPTDFGPFMREKYRTKDMEPTEKGL